MKILYTIASSDAGPVANHILELVRGFHQEFDIQIVAGTEGYLTAAARELGAECYTLPDLAASRDPFKAARVCNQLSRVIATLQPDLVHAHACRAGLLSRIAAARCRVPAVYTAHEWCFDRAPSPWNRLSAPFEWLAAKRYSQIIAASDEVRRSALRRGIDPRRIVTIRPGIADLPLQANPARAMVPNIVMAAPLDSGSNHQMVLEAFAGVDAPALLTFAGDGANVSWMRGLAHKLGIGSRVRFLGDRDDIPQILSAAHVCAYSVRKAQGLPPVILEAMRAGLPLVASDTGTIGEAITNGENGYLTPPNDVAGFRNALWALAADSSLRGRMGEAARFRYEQNFSVTQMLAKTETVYERVWENAGVAAQRKNFRRRAATAANQ